ncbi:MAG TPA: VOC family protein [Ktedonobacterales bacterium]|nr:VOC family protein [Ktedonobacterales bacterium]
MASEANAGTYHTVTPYLIVRGAGDPLDFLARALGARKVRCEQRPDGSIAHAEVSIGDSIVMVGEPADAMRPMPTSLYLAVDDVDVTDERAMHAGAPSLGASKDQPYGRGAGVEDAGGNIWWITEVRP